MTAIKEVIRRFGMPDAISWPAFWATFLSALVGNFVTNSGTVPIFTRVGILILGSFALFGVLLPARALFFRDPQRSRPVVMLVALAVGVLVRAVLISELFALAVGPAEAKLGARLLGAVINTGLAYVLTASVVGAIRERRRQIATLQSQRLDIEYALSQVATGMDAQNEQTIARVRSVLLAELGALEGASAGESLAVLQSTASDVVRPMSHELALAVPRVESPPGEADPTTVSWPTVIDQAATGRPFSAWIVGLLIAIECLGAVLHEPRGAVVFLALIGVLIGLVACANWALERVLPGRALSSRITLVVVASIVVGALIGGLEIRLLGTSSVNVAIGLAMVFFISAFSLGTAVILALGRDRDRVIRELQISAEQLHRSLVMLRQAQWLHQKALSRALHGPVQMAVTAAAIRLDTAIREDAVHVDLIDNVRAELLATLDVLNQEASTVATFDQAVIRLAAVWEGICDITAQVDADADRSLQSDAALRSCVIDIVTEAASNAVRHGKAQHVTVDLAVIGADGSTLVLRVRNDGLESEESAGRGLGSTLLDECTLEWSRGSAKGGHVLVATLPVAVQSSWETIINIPTITSRVVLSSHAQTCP